jgi:hypothetical protein
MNRYAGRTESLDNPEGPSARCQHDRILEQICEIMFSEGFDTAKGSCKEDDSPSINSREQPSKQHH